MNAAPAPSCIRCGYDLSGQPAAPPAQLTCPECGEQNAGREREERYLFARAVLCITLTVLGAVIAPTSLLIGALVLAVGGAEGALMMRLARGWELIFCAPFALLPIIGLAIMAIFLLPSLL